MHRSASAWWRRFAIPPTVSLGQYAEPNFVRPLSARTPNDPRFVDLWGLASPTDRDIDASEAWDLTTGSEGVVVVAVVDSGVQYTHVDPRTYLRLGRGLHTFRVRAIDRAGNVDPTPAKRTWRIR